MSDDKTVPLNAEHIEAMQFYTDKERYEAVSKMTPEQQEAHKQMEKAVEILVGSNTHFILLASLPDDELKFWKYQSLTKEKVPFSKGEGHKIMLRTWHALATHVRWFAKMVGHSVVFHGEDKKPYYVITPTEDLDLYNEDGSPKDKPSV